MLQSFPMYAYIPAKDVARARQFYEGKLGFRPKQEVAGGVIYEFGDKTACFLYPTPNAGTSQASQAFWQVACRARSCRVEGARRQVTTCRATRALVAWLPPAARRRRGSRTPKATS